MCFYLSETKLKGKGEVVGRVSGMAGGPVTVWVVDEVCSRMDGDVIQAYVG